MGSHQRNIHRRKNFGGRITAEEVHRAATMRKCQCGLPGAICIRSFAPVDEIAKRNPFFFNRLAAQNEGQIPLVDFKGPGGLPVKYVRVGLTYACDLCKKTAETTAAKAPSWIVVEIDRGPGPDAPVVQVS